MSLEGLHIFEAPSFENQFKERESVNTVGGVAEVVDVKPENMTDEVPAFLAPAWACGIETYRQAIRNLYNENRRVVSLSHPRFGGDMSLAPEEAVEKYPEAELRKALTIIDVINKKDFAQVDAIGHSESAINLLIAAMIHPEKFRNIVLFAPAGLIGPDTFTRLMKGFLKQNNEKPSMKATPDTLEMHGYKAIGDASDEDKENASKASILEGLKYITNPLRSLREVIDISKSDIFGMIQYLRDKDIGIAVMTGVDDPVFQMDKMQSILKAGSIDGFLSVRGGHGEIGGIGEHSELYMKGIAQTLESLKNKKEHSQDLS